MGVVHTVGITITTGDDDTHDMLLDFLEAFGRGDLRDFLSNHDPLSEVILDSSDGVTVVC